MCRCKLYTRNIEKYNGYKCLNCGFILTKRKQKTVVKKETNIKVNKINVLLMKGCFFALLNSLLIMKYKIRTVDAIMEIF